MNPSKGCDDLDQGYKRFEALDWLRVNGNPSALATNRFGGTVNAIEFVERLYGWGALKVSVTDIWDEPERIEAEGGPYASSLIVELSPDPEKREEILRTYMKEMERDEYDGNAWEGFDAQEVKELDFWWD